MVLRYTSFFFDGESGRSREQATTNLVAARGILD